MRRIILVHKYLSCFVAPAMVFFALSGAWQAYRFNDDSKDGSYKAPEMIQTLSHLHKAERLSGAGAGWFRAGQTALAAAFLVTAMLGVSMAFRLTRPSWKVWACLAAGVAVPLLLALASRAG